MVKISQLWYKRQDIVLYHSQFPMKQYQLVSIYQNSPSTDHRYHPANEFVIFTLMEIYLFFSYTARISTSLTST